MFLFQIELDFTKLHPGTETRFANMIDNFCNSKIVSVLVTNVTEGFSKGILKELQTPQYTNLSQGKHYYLKIMNQILNIKSFLQM